jgi:hypothetical protein
VNHAYAVAACLVLAIAVAPSASAQTNLEKRVTIDVTEVTPQKVFDLLARELDCKITVDQAVKKPLTLRLVDRPASDIIVTICQSIECEWRFDGKNLFIKPLSAGTKSYTASMEKISSRTEERSKKFESRLPTGMHFDETPLQDVLDTIGKTAGLELRPWKDEGGRKVTIDVGGKTVSEALEAVLRRIDGEGVVMLRTGGRGSWGQYRVVDRRRGP